MFRVGEVDALAIAPDAVARNDFGKGHRESPFQVGFEGDGRAVRDVDGAAAFLSADLEFRNQDFAGGHKKMASAQSVQDRLPAFIKSRELVEPQVIDVHVGVGLEIRLHAERIHFADDLLFGAPIRHVIQQVQHAPTQRGAGQVGLHGFPSRAQKTVGLEEGLIFVDVGKILGAFDPGVRGPHEAAFFFQ